MQSGGHAAVNDDPFVAGANENGAQLSGEAKSWTLGPVPAPKSDSDAGSASLAVGTSKLGPEKSNTSPPRPRPTFTTDVGPGVNVPGGHYLKVIFLSVTDLSDTLKPLYEDVS